MSQRAERTGTLGVLVVGVLLLAANIGMWVVLDMSRPKTQLEDPQSLRDVASKLASVGVKGEAARYYERYLDKADVSDLTRAQVGLALARLLKEGGQLEEALGYLYRAEKWAPDTETAKDAAPLIVEILERLNRPQAAQTALSNRSKIDRSAAPADANDTVVAKIGERNITRSELDRALETLPPQLQKQLEDPQKLQQFLGQYVAQELLYDKALKRALDKDPQVRQRVEELTRQVMVNRMIEEELQDKVRADESDLRNYFEAHKDRFKGQEQDETPTFEQVKDQVMKAYVMEKAQSLSQDLLAQAQAAQEVQLFPEALGAEKADSGDGQ